MAIAVSNQGTDKVSRQHMVNAYLATSAAGPTALLAADAEYLNDMTSLTIINGAASAQSCTISDGAVDVFIVTLPSTIGGSVTLTFGGGGPAGFWKQAAKNTAWNVTQTATACKYIATFRKTPA